MSAKNKTPKTIKETAKEIIDNKSVEIDRKAIDLFSKELSELIKKHKIVEYAGAFIISGKSILSYYPDDITATRLLKQAHANCREIVIQKIGG